MTKYEIIPCDFCKGAGTIYQDKNERFQNPVSNEKYWTCPKCDGEGSILKETIVKLHKLDKNIRRAIARGDDPKFVI